MKRGLRGQFGVFLLVLGLVGCQQSAPPNAQAAQDAAAACARDSGELAAWCQSDQQVGADLAGLAFAEHAIASELAKLEGRNGPLASAFAKEAAAFRRYGAAVCDQESAPQQSACVSGLIGERRSLLQRALTTSKPLTFLTLTRYDAQLVAAPSLPDPADAASPDTQADPTRFVVTQADAYLQIVAPRTPAQRAWNQLMEQPEPANQRDPSTSTQTDVEITLAQNDLIAVFRSGSYFGLGAAHPVGFGESVNWSLRHGRALSVIDLFASNTDWITPLTERCLTQLRARAIETGLAQNPQEAAELIRAEDVRKYVSEPTRWILRPQALGIYFAPYDIGPYVFGAHEIAIPWADLRAILNRTLPFAIAPPAPKPGAG